MSDHSAPSSAGHGPTSSPYAGAGTEPTVYSPELFRQYANGTAQQNATTGEPFKLPMPIPMPEGAFINEISEDARNFISRRLFVLQLPDGTRASTDPQHEMAVVQREMKLYAAFIESVPYYGRGMFIRFDDVREATEAADILIQACYLVQHVTGYDHAVAKQQDTNAVYEFEGQIRVVVSLPKIHGPTVRDFTQLNIGYVRDYVKQQVGRFGDLRNCIHVESDDVRGTLTFRVEFYSVDAANRAVAAFILEQDSRQTPHPYVVSHWTGERAKASPHRHKPRIDGEGRIADFRAQKSFLPTYPSQHPQEFHNQVQREKIVTGKDVRTTVMLRNLPNRLDYMELKAVLDKYCFGTFDFVYLRIDFSTQCNVGYAFINFADVRGMIQLIDGVQGKHWGQGYITDKVTEVSYATIQGLEALLQKFRNSSVMSETPFCRPRLYRTTYEALSFGNFPVGGRPPSNGNFPSNDSFPSTGTPKPFPGPNNMSKLQRSMDSARTTGLFPPHSHTATDRRDFSSTYDRGTPRYTATARGHAVPFAVGPAISLNEISSDLRHSIEVWYAHTHAIGSIIVFNDIPLGAIVAFFAEQQSVYGSFTTARATRLPGFVTLNANPSHASADDSVFGPGPASHGGHLGDTHAGSASGGSGSGRRSGRSRRGSGGPVYYRY